MAAVAARCAAHHNHILCFSEKLVCDLIGVLAVSATGNLDPINWLPHIRTLNQVVHVEDGTAVRDVMIDGRFVARDGRLLTLDLAKLARERLERPTRP